MDTHESEFSDVGSELLLTDGCKGRAMLVRITYARSQLIPPGSPKTFHCVSEQHWTCQNNRTTLDTQESVFSDRATASLRSYQHLRSRQLITLQVKRLCS